MDIHEDARQFLDENVPCESRGEHHDIINEKMNGQANDRTSEITKERTGGRTDKQTEGATK